MNRFGNESGFIPRDLMTFSVQFYWTFWFGERKHAWTIKDMGFISFIYVYIYICI